jgi:PAS domain S-box-containing protein
MAGRHGVAEVGAVVRPRRLVSLALVATAAISSVVVWGLWRTYDAAVGATAGVLAGANDPLPAPVLGPRGAGVIGHIQQGQHDPSALLFSLGAVAAGFVVLVLTWLAVAVALRRRLDGERRVSAEARRQSTELEARIAARTRELRATEERAQAILDNTTAVIYVKDLDGRYVVVNRRFEALFGVTKAGVIGHTDHDIFPHHMADAFRANDRQVIASACPLEFDEVAPHGDGPHTYISIKFPLTDDLGRTYAVCGISTDITARQQAEDAARRRQAELAHVLRLTTINEMATTLAHEISQPLTAIVNYSAGCLNYLDDAGDAPAELRPAIVEIQEQAMHARAVLARLREFVRRREPGRESVNLNALVEDAARLAHGEAREHRVVLRLELAPALSPVRADPVQLEQVILNLVHNGIEAMSDQRMNGDELVISTAQRADGAVEVRVRDGGKGLSPALAREMFDPFVTTKAHGLGMGLAISRTIVEAHGGKIWATPHTGGGTTVGFTLPATCSKEAA